MINVNLRHNLTSINIFFVASHTDIFFKDNDNIKMYRNFFLKNE